MKTVIGVTSSFDVEKDTQVLPANYTRAVESSGGIPFLIPAALSPALADEILSRVNGLLLSGGYDVDPQWFGENPHPKLGTVSPERDNLEISLARGALQKNIPILAICRGLQLLNVAAGGTLYQDIHDQVPGSLKHRQDAPRWYGTHEILIEKDCLLAQVLGTTRLRVNSFHHQSVKAVAPHFKITATAPDGIVEAIEPVSSKLPVLAVQWHPEGMFDQVPVFKALFTWLVQIASP